MLENRLTAFAESIVRAVRATVAKTRALENVAELVAAGLGLLCIAIGLAVLWTGHTS